MPAYDYRCDTCGLIHEAFYRMADKPSSIPCPKCGAESTSYPSIGLIKGDEAAWLQDTLKVVDKDGGEHCQRFLKDPTRSNYQKWMKGEGLRPLEDGERPHKPTEKERRAARQQEVKKLAKTLYEDRKVTVK